jgi:hypothetical protein
MERQPHILNENATRVYPGQFWEDNRTPQLNVRLQGKSKVIIDCK